MSAAYDLHAPKKAINLSANSDLLGQARVAEINLSATFEAARAQALRQKQAEQWLAEHRGAIQAYNAQVEASGVFSDGLRSF